MDGVEDLGLVHPDARERGDGEEAAVVQLGVAAAPADQPVVLAVVHGAGQAGLLRGRLLRRVRRREDLRGAQTGLRLGRLERSGGEGVDVVPVAQTAALGVDDETVQLRVRVPVRAVSQHGDEQGAAAGRPVHVEPRRMRRLGTVGEHVPPRRIGLGRGHAHVVRHDVHEHAHARLVRGVRDHVQPLGPAAGGVQPRGVHDVVSVVGAGLGLEQRREVEPVHAQAPQIGHEPGHGLQRQIRADLEPVGGRGGGTDGRGAHAATLTEAPDAASGPTDGGGRGHGAGRSGRSSYFSGGLWKMSSPTKGSPEGSTRTISSRRTVPSGWVRSMMNPVPDWRMRSIEV